MKKIFTFIFQDPTELKKFNISDFFHLKNNLKVIDEGNIFFG